MPDPVETYLTDLRDIHSTGAGVEETSYYTALANLLAEIGKKLKPRVRCIINIQNAGAGLPDGGLFTPDQFLRSAAGEPRPGQMPARGAIEVKGANENVLAVAETRQVQDYLRLYRQVLVTNYREFLLVGYDHEGRPAKLESYRLADDARSLWSAVAHPQKMAKEHGERLIEYLKRAMLRRVELVEPKDVAWFLASYAREAKARVEARRDLPELAAIRSALEEALGMKFEGEKGEHFFRSTLVQTLFYGVFSAWVLWDKHHKGDPAARFNWHEAGWYLHVPMISALFQQISSRAQLGPLDVAEVLDWASEALNRVNRGEFFSRFEEGQAVQYFYEPFLRAFDPDLRKELGVWYTPPEIVQYMVERVDRVLRDELGIADGLADPNVYVLDPCCGTGAYLVEVLKRIRQTLEEKGGDALVGQDLKKAAMGRVFGFELLPAPFVISHLQLGLLLQNLGAPLSDEGGERAGVFLTNALTGWEPPQGEKKRLPFIELEQERDAAEKVKREVPILVILGNPPYNGFAGVSPEEEGGLVEPYKEGLREWGITKNYLDDLYVRFFRLAERRIAERDRPGRGVVCYISNFSYLDDPSFVIMRQRFLGGFQRMWFDCMNGDSRETGKRTPDGKPDPSVFSSDHNTQGIRVGTAVALMVRHGQGSGTPAVLYRDFWGTEKRAELVASLTGTNFNASYRAAAPAAANRFSLRPETVSDEYASWPDIPALAGPLCSLGILDNRAGALVSIDRAPLVARMGVYYDPSRDFDEVASVDGASGITSDAARFDARKTRHKVLSAESFAETAVRRGMVRPMDQRWCYYSQVRPLWNEPRPEYGRQCWPGNGAFATRKRGVASPEGVPFAYTTGLGFQHALMSDAYYFPVRLQHGHAGNGPQGSLIDSGVATAANLSPSARAYLASRGITDPDADAETAGLIWMHALAIGYSPAYLSENADGIRRDWPRVPLPASKEALLASAELGKKIAALLDTENPVAGVTSGDIRKELREIAVISRDGGGALDPAAGELAVKAGWGHAGKGGVTMPGSGKLVKRAYSPEEAAAMATVAGASPCPTGRGGEMGKGQELKLPPYGLGESTRDVHLNDVAYWRNVPEKVWGYTIGGYQVMKKWLSYREEDLLGRSLTMDEAREVTNNARRIAAILLLEPELDGNYQTVKANAFPWAEIGGK
jgi:hypothetical protein